MSASAPAGTTALSGGVVTHWHTIPAHEVVEILETGDAGLTQEEAGLRLERYGPNRIEEEREAPWWSLALHQFRDPLIYILLGAALVTLILRDYSDSGVILAVVFINALIGYSQERRAQRAIRGLARLTAPRAEVLRDGAVHAIESEQLVPGDVVLLTSGVRVPADLRLLRVRDLEIDESALTGESVPVRKSIDALASDTLVAGDQLNMAFAGTTVTRGRARGCVVRTGAATELGRIASAMREVGRTMTPLQERMARFGKQVGLIVLGLALLVLAIGLLRRIPPLEIFLGAVAIAVSAIPEGLPVVLTVTLAIGVRRMARRSAIVRSLPAVETLGCTTVIGSDKTGTLTQNEMTVRRIWADGRFYTVTGAGYGYAGEIAVGDGLAGKDEQVVTTPDAGSALSRTLLVGLLANEADAVTLGAGEHTGDPTDLALIVSAAKGGMEPVHTRTVHAEIDLLPFESERRLMATRNVSAQGAPGVYLKGAPEAVLRRCDRMLTNTGSAPLNADAVARAARELASGGLRVIAMAYAFDGDTPLDRLVERSRFVFAGLQGMEDPVRPEVISAVRDAHGAGIRVIMLTGDHADTAMAVARKLGIADDRGRAIEGHELEPASDEQLDLILDQVSVFARVAPEHKFRIVRRLRDQGEVVAVTGDGVNDAPALRAAHLGVAMGRSGTDVAREASDMVLADDNFATITAAVEEGRRVFGNIRKVTFFLLSTAVGEIITILAALMLGWPLPFIAVQILWINLVTNGLQDVALAFEKGEPGMLRRPPRPISEGIVDLRLLERLGGVGIVLAAGTLAVFWWSWQTTGDLAYARTLAMTQMVVFQFFHVFNSRSLDRSILRIPPFSNHFLFVSIIAAVAAHLAVLYLAPMQKIFRTLPLSAEDWLLVVAVGSTVVLGGELDKWRNRRSGRLLG